MELGIGAAAGGILLVVAYGIMRPIAIDQVDGPENRAAAGAVWDAFLGDLRTASWILAASGAVVAAAAASLLKPVDVRVPLRRAAAWVTREPEHPALKVLRGAGFVAAGLLLILQRDAVLRLLFTLAGVYLIYEGVLVILRLVYRAPVPGEPRRPAPAASARGTRRRRVAVSSIAVVLIAVTVAVFLGSGGTTTAAPATGACDGHAALCDRPLDEVVLAATHNSMSVPLPGWYSAEQERPIRYQLAEGIRGLLFDTYYGDRLSSGRVRTYFGSQEGLAGHAKEAGVSPAAVDAALRLRDRAGFKRRGRARAVPLPRVLRARGDAAGIRARRHRGVPRHPSGRGDRDRQRGLRDAGGLRCRGQEAGLADLAYDGPTSGDWPTLREMIDDNQRIVFLAENHAGAAPWYRPAYEQILQETPFPFSKASQLTTPSELPASCKPNRGPEDAPLFLLNHWITTTPVARPSDAAKVNAYEPLLRRARECRRLRGKLPNLVAVNFYREGDTFRVVDTLNGLR